MNRIDYERQFTIGWRAYIAGNPRESAAKVSRDAERGWVAAQRADERGRDIFWPERAKKGGA